MKKTLCLSVRLRSLRRISPLAYRAEAFDGSSDIIPASQVFGIDDGVQKSDAYWISAWILEKKNLQYSAKKQAWFSEDGRMLPTVTVDKHHPDRVEPVESNEIESLAI